MYTKIKGKKFYKYLLEVDCVILNKTLKASLITFPEDKSQITSDLLYAEIEYSKKLGVFTWNLGLLSTFKYPLNAYMVVMIYWIGGASCYDALVCVLDLIFIKIHKH